MKSPLQIPNKVTTRLFYNAYKYKVVLISPAAGWFRNKDFENVAWRLANPKDNYHGPRTHEEKEYVKSLLAILPTLDDYNLRVESPLLSFYTNNEKDALKIAKIEPKYTKYISSPSKDSEHLLEYNTVILKRIDYGYRVTMGSCPNTIINFVQWCENNPKVQLTSRAKKELSQPRSWGGSHFYVKDDKSLTMVKMFLGSYISKIERVVKS